MTAMRAFSSLLLAAGLVAGATCPAQGLFDEAAADRDLRHQTPEWMSLASHLPDPATGSPVALQVAADVLRARRMPEDALEYYRFALKRGGDEASLMNRIGITQLELRQIAAAKLSFKRAVALKSKDSESWNNLGAAEYVSGNYVSAIQDYQRAVKLNKKAAVFHSNLGTAYFQTKDYESARRQFASAVSLDHAIFQRGGFGGIQAHVMSPADRGRFCFELAKLAAKSHDDDSVIEWLSKSAESGFDIRYEMSLVADFGAYQKDTRVIMLIKNAKLMRAGQIATATPALPPDAPHLD